MAAARGRVVTHDPLDNPDRGLVMTRDQDVIGAWAKVMTEVQSVGKDGTNTQQGYRFRGIDGVMNAVGPALRKHGVVIVPTVEEANYREVEVGAKRTLQRECTVKVRYTVYGPSGGWFSGTVYGEALDSGDKATAKAHSVAYRTFLLQSLTIPTDDPDPDQHTVERSAREPVRLPMHPNKVASLRERCAAIEASVSEVVRDASGGRTDNPEELFADEADAVKAALEKVTPADA